MNTTEFKGSLSISEAVSKLTILVKEKPDHTGKSVLRGGVSHQGVYLYRFTPLFGNAFRPVFKGTFQEQNGQAVLTGKFQMHWIGRFGMIIWFSIAAFILALAVFSQITQGLLNLLQVIIPGALFIAGGILIVCFGKWLSRNDKSYIANAIQTGLSG